MQAKDLDTKALLELFAVHQGQWCFWHDDKLSWREGDTRIEVKPFPVGTPYKVIQAKFINLHKRGFIGGCPCGCRGDFEITDKGLAFIGQSRTKPYNGY